MKSKDIYLTKEERGILESVRHKGMHNAHEMTRAHVLLLLDRTGKSDHVRYKRIAEYAGISVQAVYNMRDEFFTNHDLEAYLTRKKRETPPIRPKLDGEAEAKIIALSCSQPPEGRSRWTVRLLQSKAIELHLAEDISHMVIQRLLKKHSISLT